MNEQILELKLGTRIDSAQRCATRQQSWQASAMATLRVPGAADARSQHPSHSRLDVVSHFARRRLPNPFQTAAIRCRPDLVCRQRYCCVEECGHSLDQYRAVDYRGLSLPIPLRLLPAAQPEFVTPVLQAAQRVLTRHLLDGSQL